MTISSPELGCQGREAKQNSAESLCEDFHRERASSTSLLGTLKIDNVTNSVSR
jgi:hypothetical protein